MQYSKSAYIGYDSGSAKGLKRIKSEDVLLPKREPLLVRRNRRRDETATAVLLSGFKGSDFDVQFSYIGEEGFAEEEGEEGGTGILDGDEGDYEDEGAGGSGGSNSECADEAVDALMHMKGGYA